MKLDIVPVGSSQKKLQFVIPADAVRAEFDSVYRRIGQGVRLQGFRPGKAPRRVLEMRFGKQVADEVAGNLIQAGYTNALSEHGVEPIGRPEVDQGAIAPSRDFEFSILVDVKPEIELSVYKGVEVVYPKVEVTDAEVEQLVARRLEGQSRLVEVSDRAVQAGDFALVELHVSEDGAEVVVEPGTMIRTAGDPYFPGVEAFLVGMAVGEEKSGKVSFSERAETAAIAGRSLDVTAKVVSIQANQVPELTDELATELGFEGGADGMRAALRAQLTEARDANARNQARANALQALIDANVFDVPRALVDRQLDALVQELRLQAAYRGQDPRTVNFSAAQIGDLRVRAEFAAKGSLILDYVTRVEGLVVTEADVDARLQELADERGQSVEALKGYLVREEGAEEDFRARLLEEKALDFLLENSVLVDASSASAKAATVAAEPSASAPAAETTAAAAGGPDLSILDGAVGAIKDALATGLHDADLAALLAAEEAGKARKGAIAAIKARLEG